MEGFFLFGRRTFWIFCGESGACDADGRFGLGAEKVGRVMRTDVLGLVRRRGVMLMGKERAICGQKATGIGANVKKMLNIFKIFVNYLRKQKTAVSLQRSFKVHLG